MNTYRIIASPIITGVLRVEKRVGWWIFSRWEWVDSTDAAEDFHAIIEKHERELRGLARHRAFVPRTATARWFVTDAKQLSITDIR